MNYLRSYSKFHVNTNRKEGSDKIILGWEQNNRETILRKDTETYFHVPAFTESVPLAETTLIADGATAGPFPAAADRIFENRKNFGNTTANGNTKETADGTWFCSWLYKDAYGNAKWMDRFYNPGEVKYEQAFASLSSTEVYVSNNPVFRDIPSTMTLDQGVMYRYFHIGEDSAKELITTFGGISGERLKLNLTDWTTDSVDTSNEKNTVNKKTNGASYEIFKAVSDSDRTEKQVINFDNLHTSEAFVEYKPNFNPTNEFTMTAWAQSKSWKDSPYTQIAGNYSSGGGYGLFIEAFNTYPFIVIPENYYGHLLFINQDGRGFTDKMAQTTSIACDPRLFLVNSDYHVIVCNKDDSGTIQKMDHTGKILASTKNINDPSLLFSFSTINEMPQQILGAESDTFYISTNKAIYKFDSELKLLQTIAWSVTPSTKMAIKYNTVTGTHSLIIKDQVAEVKYVEENEWSISSVDGHLYLNSMLYELFYDEATNFSIDPLNRIWVLHGTNKLTIIDAETSQTVKVVDVGTNQAHSQKSITFLKKYDRTTSEYEWNCLIHYADESELYFLTIEGDLTRSSSMVSIFDFNIIRTYNQNRNNFTYYNDGDFTGYETRRIFEKLPPFNGRPQLVLKTCLKDKTKFDLTYKLHKSYSPIDGWDEESWQHFVCILKNKQFKVYINGLPTTAEINYDGTRELSYEQQPDFFIGVPNGSRLGFNQELGHTTCIFNGYIADVKVFDYALDPKKLDLFLREALVAQNILWSLPIPTMHFIEQVERMFKNKVPGSKGTFFNLKLAGTLVEDPRARAVIEKEIKTAITEIKPAITELVKIQWID